MAPSKNPPCIRNRGKNRRDKREGGFALLLIFLMASIVAITLYMELPRIAMQSQRDKEETLIDRGEQYKRAIQLFVAKAKRYPADIKELENFQNQRFLRHRYIDPMTGKDEWRLIHIQNGMLTDSKLAKPTAPGGKEEPKTPNGFVGELAGLGSVQAPTQGGGAASARDRRRPSEGANGTMPGPMPGQAPAGGDLAGGQNSGAPPLPGQGTDNGPTALPGTINPATGQPVLGPNGQPALGQNGQPVLGTNGQPVLGPNGQPVLGPNGQPVLGQNGQPVLGPNGQPVAGQNGQPVLGPNGQPLYPPGMTMPSIPGGIAGRLGAAPGNTTNTNPSTNSNSGSSFVGGGGSFVGGGSSFVGGSVTGTQPGYPGQISTLPGQPGPAVNSQTGSVSPYQTGAGSNGNPPGFPQPGATAGQGNSAADMIRNILTTPRPGGMPQSNPGSQTIGGGIAGVATTAQGEGVKVYNQRSLYQEWEFIYDQTKQKQIPNPNATGAGGTPADRMNNNPTSPNPNTSPTPNPSPLLPGR